ncbi:tetratricopeptide repeat protein [Thermosipho ferrireducens]|uniref:tetratricopeptide repeat protein n=1 Tax=Thermosipho ferrireducens TaxID=2571116 RepID=UPI001D18CD6B|nr:tetratricopeptide repeat protein [Thermosipho ferrireducens]
MKKFYFNLFLLWLFISMTAFGYSLNDLKMAVGERDQKKVLEILESLDFKSVSLDFQCEIAFAYTEIYVWGNGNVKKYQKLAHEYAKYLLEKAPSYWKTHYVVAMVLSHYVQRNVFLALVYANKIFYHAEKAVEYGDNQYLTHLLYGVLNLETPFGDLNKAGYHLKKALSLNPKHVYTYVELGKYYEKLGKYEKALEMYKKALEVEGEKNWKYINIEGREEATKRILEVEKRCTEK